MIITLTMNPAIDQTIRIDHLIPGELNHALSSRNDVGGKGINVSRMLLTLGSSSIAVAAAGGETGRAIMRLTEELGISGRFYSVAGESRTNRKLLSYEGGVTELNEYGPTLTENELEGISGLLLANVTPKDIVVLSGSLPRGASASFYKDLILRLRQKDAFIILDASGEAFRQGIEALPSVIKPNDRELSEYFYPGEGKILSEKELILCGRKLIERGIDTVVISRGSLGAVFINKETIYTCPALSVNAASTVGAGDSMVAALAYAKEEGMCFEDAAKLAMAASAGACTTEGTLPPAKSVINELYSDVNLLFYKIDN